jgi:hypothetical protein
MVHKTGGSRENYPRVLLEAYAHGVVPIVEDAYGLPELVVHGETGYLTCDSDEMSYYASMLAMNPAEHRRLAANGREHLEQTLVSHADAFRGWEQVLATDGSDTASATGEPPAPERFECAPAGMTARADRSNGRPAAALAGDRG